MNENPKPRKRLGPKLRMGPISLECGGCSDNRETNEGGSAVAVLTRLVREETRGAGDWMDDTDKTILGSWGVL